MIIAIEGNIGCGKSTQLELLQTKNFNVYKEPIDSWPLQEFYDNPSRWGFLLQIVILRTFVKGTHPLSIHERSPLSSKYIFWKNLVDSKIVTKLEDTVYQTEFDLTGWSPDVMIYIETTPELCKKHIENRTQPGDKDISVDYLKLLDHNYDEMYKNHEGTKYKIDGSQSIDQIQKTIIDIITNKRTLNSEISFPCL